MIDNSNKSVSSLKFFGPKTFNLNYFLGTYIFNPIFWTKGLFFFGIIIRLVQYLHNRSLYMDDAALALNVVNRSFSQLLKPLDYDQGAPFGFLAISKIFTLILGANEFALRLFPLLTGIFALILFYWLSKRYLSPFGVLIAVGLFSVLEPLFYYATAFKQYSSDVFFTIALLLLFVQLKAGGTSKFNLILFSLVGSLVIWFSFPAAFILAGIGIYSAFYFLKNLEWKSFLKVLLVCTVWLISFALYYYVTFLGNLSHSNYMQEFWSDSFMPIPSLSFRFFRWFVNVFFSTFSFIMNNDTSALAGSFFIIGIIYFYKKNKELFYIFILPIFITLLVSCFHLYPFNDRLILFLIPSILIFLAGGLEMLKNSTIIHTKILIIPAILLLSIPSYFAALHLRHPIERDEVRQALSYMSKNIQSDDEIYLYNRSVWTFEFYKKQYNLTKYPIIRGIYSKNWDDYINDLNKLKGKNSVWFLFSHIKDNTDEKVLILSYLDRIGIMKQSFKATGTEIYHFNFPLNKVNK